MATEGMRGSIQFKNGVSGVYAALATPRRPQSIEPNTAAMLEYMETIARTGVDGFVLFGATGEFVHLNTDQRNAVCSLALKRSRLPVLVNISHSTLEGALELAEAAKGLGAAGLLLMPPFFYKYSEGDILRFYAAFFRAFGPQTPVYLYNLPFFTNPLSAEMLGRLLVDLPFAGIKDSSGEWEMFEALLAIREKRSFELIAGHERIFTEARQAGAVGIISGVAAGLPELMVRLDRAIRDGDGETSQRLDARLHQLLGWLSRFPTPQGIKQVAMYRGWPQDSSATPPDDALVAEYREWLSGWLPETLAACR